MLDVAGARGHCRAWIFYDAIVKPKSSLAFALQVIPSSLRVDKVGAQRGRRGADLQTVAPSRVVLDRVHDVDAHLFPEPQLPSRGLTSFSQADARVSLTHTLCFHRLLRRNGHAFVHGPPLIRQVLPCSCHALVLRDGLSRADASGVIRLKLPIYTPPRLLVRSRRLRHHARTLGCRFALVSDSAQTQ